MDSNITIYSTSSCGFCKMLKSYLNDKGIKYNEKMVDEDQDLARELYEKSGQLGVPFTTIEKFVKKDQVLVFDREKIDSILGL